MAPGVEATNDTISSSDVLTGGGVRPLAILRCQYTWTSMSPCWSTSLENDFLHGGTNGLVDRAPPRCRHPTSAPA